MDSKQIKYNFQWTQKYRDSLTGRFNHAIYNIGKEDDYEAEVTDDNLVEANIEISRIMKL